VRGDPFGALAPLLAAAARAPFPPVLTVLGDDEWFVAEAARRVSKAFLEAFPDGEVADYEGAGNGVKEAVADAATIALFATNRLVSLDVTDLLRTRKLTADEIDALLDEATDAGLGAPPGAPSEPRVLDRLARKARGLARDAGALVEGDPAETARKLTGRVKRSDRAPDLASLLALPVDDGEAAETALDRLLDYVLRATPGDNVLLLRAVSPDPDHAALAELRRTPVARLFAADDAARRERLHALGLERVLERGFSAEPDVFETLTERGRLTARAFLSELDRLVETAPGPRVTAEAAARLVADERKEYGSDFVEAVARKKFLEALRIAERLFASEGFTAFRSFGKEDASAPAKKGPKGEAAFFPLLGLLAADVRRMLAVKAALAEPGADPPARRADYRVFVDRVLPRLKAERPGAAPIPVEGHPFVLHKAYLASFDWTLDELSEALTSLAAIDRGVKTGAGTGPELLQTWLLTKAAPSPAGSGLHSTLYG
jgi:DNA polymerase III delta subunit